MKKLLLAAILVVTTSVWADAETKKVCVDKRDSKGNIVKKADGTVVQDCKEIKVHKKLEGTKVPDKK
jgi:hypothetical protein